MYMRQYDVSKACRHGDIEQDIYMLPPHGLDIPAGSVIKLRKSLYGLKQSPRC